MLIEVIICSLSWGWSQSFKNIIFIFNAPAPNAGLLTQEKTKAASITQHLNVLLFL